MSLITKILVLAAMLFFGCSRKEQLPPPAYGDMREELIRMNKDKAEGEAREIDAFIAKKGLSMKETGTGLNYAIYHHGEGDSARNGDVALIRYSVSLLDGTLCYQTGTDEFEKFLIGQDQVESGLHEGVKLLRAGDKAYFVLPSHLAFGLTGDRSKIPGDASLFYDLELLALE